jgi:mannose-6-phosphate isomerase-like protein (cupin superfamily)
LPAGRHRRSLAGLAREIGVMNETTNVPRAMTGVMKLAVTRKSEPNFIKGRRDFFKYRELGVTDATGGKMRAQITSASQGLSRPTGWHYHACEAQFVYMLDGWLELEFENGEKCRLEAGDSVMIPGGMKHNETRTSDKMELLEISLPAEMGTVACEAPG